LELNLQLRRRAKNGKIMSNRLLLQMIKTRKKTNDNVLEVEDWTINCAIEPILNDVNECEYITNALNEMFSKDNKEVGEEVEENVEKIIKEEDEEFDFPLHFDNSNDNDFE
jgi:septum formation inhibitor-activating ATPase MinD